MQSISDKRRAILRASIAASFATALLPQAFAAPTDDTWIWPLWPDGEMPGGRANVGMETKNRRGSLRHVSEPRLIVYPAARTSAATASTAAVMVCAGGGYAHIERGNESIPACRWLQAQGITAFELIYRLPEEGWDHTAPLQDAQRAMRLIHSICDKSSASAAQAARLPALAADRLGVLGFSAGGHLVGLTAATPQVSRYAAIDAIDTQPSTAAYAGLIYPVLTLIPPFDQTHTRRALLGEHPSLVQAEALSVDLQVTDTMPPVFLAQAEDDPISPIDNSLRMFDALRTHHVPCEMHVFQQGGHGWGMGSDRQHAATNERHWPMLFAQWAQANHFFPN